MDVSSEACQLTQDNASLAGVEDRLKVINKDIMSGLYLFKVVYSELFCYPLSKQFVIDRKNIEVAPYFWNGNDHELNSESLVTM